MQTRPLTGSYNLFDQVLAAGLDDARARVDDER